MGHYINTNYVSNKFTSLIESMLLILPKGDSLITSNKMGPGLDLRNLFIGSNGVNGYVCEC